jgi:hypothetical protein
MAGVAAMGLTVTYAGITLTATSFNVSDQIDTADGSHLGIAPGGRREYVPTFVQREISADYISSTIVTAQTGSISITGQGGISFTGNATLTASSIGGQLGDLVKGSLSWRVV